MRRAALAVAALLLLAAAAPASARKIERMTRTVAAANGAQSSVASEVAAGEVFVRLARGVDKAAIAGVLGGTVQQDFPDIGWTLYSLAPGLSVGAALDRLKNQPGVLQADANYAYRANTLPATPLLSQQYALTRVNAFTAWDFETGATNDVTIAMIDSGIDGSGAPHVDSKLVGTSQLFDPDAADAQSANNPPTPACNHGTRTASVAAADGAAGSIAGVAWGAKAHLISLKVFNDADCTIGCGGANCGTFDSTMIAAVNYARATLLGAGLGRIVINMSLGGPSACSAALQGALNNAVSAGIPVIVSAGNDSRAVNSPANCATSTPGTGIIPAGASDSNDMIASFSSHGPELAANGVLAPGVNILVDDVGGGTAMTSGTSFSAPMISGVAALLLSKNNALTAKQVQSIIISGADNTGFTTASAGTAADGARLDAGRSLRLEVQGTAGSSDLDTKAVAYPNPFRPSQQSNVTFSIPKGTTGSSRSITIYSMSGDVVRSAGNLTWDGKNDAGALVATGTYLFVIKLGDTVVRGRVALIR